jgi:hypothetical protein
MILGLSTSTYTQIHVLISLAGIASGFIVLGGLLLGKRLDSWTVVFLATTIVTSVTGFGFPIHEFGPPHIIGVISLIVLALAVLARYPFHMNGAWRLLYVISAVTALYLNTFVGVVQSFQKIAVLHALAPAQSEPPFLIAQLAVLVLFMTLGVLASIRFKQSPRIGR